MTTGITMFGGRRRRVRRGKGLFDLVKGLFGGRRRVRRARPVRRGGMARSAPFLTNPLARKMMVMPKGLPSLMRALGRRRPVRRGRGAVTFGGRRRPVRRLKASRWGGRRRVRRGKGWLGDIWNKVKEIGGKVLPVIGGKVLDIGKDLAQDLIKKKLGLGRRRRVVRRRVGGRRKVRRGRGIFDFLGLGRRRRVVRRRVGGRRPRRLIASF